MIDSKITFQLATCTMYEKEGLFSRTSVSKHEK